MADGTDWTSSIAFKRARIWGRVKIRLGSVEGSRIVSE